jgi:hypothetical protein
LWMPPPAEAFRHSWKLTANLTISRKSAKKHATGSLLRVWVDLRRNPAKIPLKGIHSERPFKNVNFCLSSRKAIILTTGIHWVFRGLKFEPDAEIEQKGAFCKGLTVENINAMKGKNPFPVSKTRVIFNQHWLDLTIANARIQDRSPRNSHPASDLPAFPQNHLEGKRLPRD